MMMILLKKHLKILAVEDSEDDADLIARKLQKEGYGFDFKRVDNEKDLKKSLGEKDWDLIISDYILPRFSGKEALKLARDAKGDIPFIMVSGKIGEEKAVEMLKEGASDFVMKDNLSRLPFAVDRALADARFHREKQRTEDELRKVVSRYHMLAENISDIIWTLDTNKRFTFVSPSVFKVTGYGVEEILAKGLDELLKPEYHKTALKAIDQALASFEIEKSELPAMDTFDAELICKDGSIIWTESKVSLLIGPGKKLLGFLGVTRDASERKQNEQLLRESEGRLRLILDHTPDAVWTADCKGRITFINRGFVRQGVEDFVGTNFLDWIVEPYRSRAKRLFDRAWAVGETASLEVMDKNSHWWYARLNPMKSGDKVDQILFISSDITDSKKKEQERLSLARAIEQMEEGIIITDADRGVRFINEAFEESSGFKAAEIIGKPIDIIWKEERDKRLSENQKEVFYRAESWKGRLTRCRKNGPRYEAEILVSPLRDRQGQVTHYIIIERDITEEIELEQQVQRMQKMEALGTLAGGIAHDFNNILMPIIINTELLLYETAKENPTHLLLKQTLEAANRGKDLVKQILTYSRKSDVEKRPMDMVQTIKEILRFLRASLPSNIEIHQSSSVDMYTVDADAVQIQQVLMNVFKNASDSIGSHDGRIEVHLKELEVAPDNLKLYPDLKSGSYLNISIRDTGCGMDRETAEKIFNPFFTTKKPGEGTGMGLSVAQSIVKKHQGSITFSSEPEKGTAFQIFLPKSKAIRQSQGDIDDSIPGGKERILLVEDEKAVILSLKRMLESLGYQVTEMTSPMEAVKRVCEQNKSFDLVITDQTMPEMSGMDLAQELKQSGSDIPIILMTGFNESVNHENTRDASIRDLMMKPINSRDMAQAIRRVLDRVV